MFIISFIFIVVMTAVLLGLHQANSQDKDIKMLREMEKEFDESHRRIQAIREKMYLISLKEKTRKELLHEMCHQLYLLNNSK